MGQPTPTTSTTTHATTLYLDSAPAISFLHPHQGLVDALVGLDDGSFVSCSSDCTAKRWLIDSDDAADSDGIRLVGNYSGGDMIACAAEIDNNTFVTAGLFSGGLRVFNKATGECLRASTTSSVHCVIIMKYKLCIVCGLSNGSVEIRRVDDLGVIFSFDLHPYTVWCLCELQDM